MASTKPTATSPAPATRKTRADLNLVPGETAPSGPSATRAPDAEKAFRYCAEYIRDVGERSVLFWDTLRARAENIIAHDRAGKPPLLDFDYETVLNACRFERPTNYTLLRITRVG